MVFSNFNSPITHEILKITWYGFISTKNVTEYMYIQKDMHAVRSEYYNYHSMITVLMNDHYR